MVQRCFAKKVFLEISQNSQEKHLSENFLFNKVKGLRLATLSKKRLWHRCFPVNFTKFLRTPFLQNTPADCFCVYTPLWKNQLYIVLSKRQIFVFCNTSFFFELKKTFSLVICNYHNTNTFMGDEFL